MHLPPHVISDALILLRDPECREHLLSRSFALPPVSPPLPDAAICGDRCDTTFELSGESAGLFDVESYSSWLAIPTVARHAVHLGFVLHELQRTTEPALAGKCPRFDKGRFAAKRDGSLVLIERPDLGAIELLSFAKVSHTLTVHYVLRAHSPAFRAAVAAPGLDVPAVLSALTFYTSFLHKRFCESCYAAPGSHCGCAPPPPPAVAPGDFSRFRFSLFPFTGAFTATGHVALHSADGRVRVSGALLSRVTVTENQAVRPRILSVAAHLFNISALSPAPTLVPVAAAGYPPPAARAGQDAQTPFSAVAAAAAVTPLQGLSLTDVAAVDGALDPRPLFSAAVADAVSGDVHGSSSNDLTCRTSENGPVMGARAGDDQAVEEEDNDEFVVSEKRTELSKLEAKRLRRIQKNREAAARSNLKRKKYREQLVSDLAVEKRRAQNLRTIEVRLRKENRELRMTLSNRGTLAKAGMPIFSL